MDNQELREMFGGPMTCELCFHSTEGFKDHEKKVKKAEKIWKRERKLQEERLLLAQKEALVKKMTPVIREAASLAKKKKYELLKAQAEAEAEESRKKAAEAEEARLQAEAEALRQEEAFQKKSQKEFSKICNRDKKKNRDNRRREKYEF